MAVLSLSDAKAHLNITTGDHDAELSETVSEAEAAIAKKCGPLEPVAKTSRVSGCADVLVLPASPIVSLTSVTAVGGAAVDVADLYLDGPAGIVSYDVTGRFTATAYTVVYQAGRATCPDDLVRAVKELTKHMWETQRGGTARPGSRGSDAYSNTLPGAAYAFPFRVEQLIAPHLQVGV